MGGAEPKTAQNKFIPAQIAFHAKTHRFDIPLRKQRRREAAAVGLTMGWV